MARGGDADVLASAVGRNLGEEAEGERLDRERWRLDVSRRVRPKGVPLDLAPPGREAQPDGVRGVVVATPMNSTREPLGDERVSGAPQFPGSVGWGAVRDDGK